MDIYVQKPGLKTFGTQQGREGDGHRTFPYAAFVAHDKDLMPYFAHTFAYQIGPVVYMDFMHVLLPQAIIL